MRNTVTVADVPKPDKPTFLTVPNGTPLTFGVGGEVCMKVSDTQYISLNNGYLYNTNKYHSGQEVYPVDKVTIERGK